jgi:hypothetical protein
VPFAWVLRRFGHTVVKMRDGSLLLYGGTDGEGTIFESVYRLTVSPINHSGSSNSTLGPPVKVTCQPLRSEGSAPEPQFGHASWAQSRDASKHGFVAWGGCTEKGEGGAFYAEVQDGGESLRWSRINGAAEVMMLRHSVVPVPGASDAVLAVGGGVNCFSFGSTFMPLCSLWKLV